MPATDRQTRFGTVRGRLAQGALSWKGIPYARPPVGDLRWRAPLDPQPWSAPRAAAAFGPACIQTGRLYGPGRHNRYDRSVGECIGQVCGAEDCLYLNIWAPAASAPDAGLPVIVFVHGGSNVTGYTADPVYDGAALAVAADALVVTVGYRLGIFGFLELPQLKASGAESGNFALLDILKALEFVNLNIDAFGGDPGNVTLMGQSAGAVNILALLASPRLAAAPTQLVHRMLPISGGLALAGDLAPGQLPVLQPLEHHARQGRALLDAALARARQRAAPDAPAAWLRAQDAAFLLRTVQADLAPLGLAASGPIPDGIVVPHAPLDAIRAGNYLRVPLLAGYTRDEGKLFPALLAHPALGGVPGRLLDDGAVFAALHDYRPDEPAQTAIEYWIAPQLLPPDAPGSGLNARMRALDALLFHPNRDALLGALHARQDSLWCYRFDWDELPAPFDAIYGAAHGFDIPFIFGNFGPSLYAAVSYTDANRAGRLALGAAMVRSIAAFARHGDPNAARGAGPAWPAWPAMLAFDADRRAAAIGPVAPPGLPGDRA